MALAPTLILFLIHSENEYKILLFYVCPMIQLKTLFCKKMHLKMHLNNEKIF